VLPPARYADDNDDGEQEIHEKNKTADESCHNSVIIVSVRHSKVCNHGSRILGGRDFWSHLNDDRREAKFSTRCRRMIWVEKGVQEDPVSACIQYSPRSELDSNTKPVE
jgi:hypothetical protein